MNEGVITLCDDESFVLKLDAILTPSSIANNIEARNIVPGNFKALIDLVSCVNMMKNVPRNIHRLEQPTDLLLLL